MAAGRSDQQQGALDRFFKGLHVEEADAPLIIVANEQDAQQAAKGDPENCALAQACKRLFNSTAVVFFRSRAYVDLPNEKGERVVKRFLLPAEARESIIHFDKTGEFPPAGFKLKAPHESQSLEYERTKSLERSRQRRAREQDASPSKAKTAGRHSALIHGEARSSTPTRRDMLSLQGVRLGTGMVHFTPVTEKEESQA